MMYSGASGSGGLVLMEFELGKKLLEVLTRQLPLKWSNKGVAVLSKDRVARLLLRYRHDWQQDVTGLFG